MKLFIFIQIKQQFVPKGPIDTKPVFSQIMACHRTDDKPPSAKLNDDLIYWRMYMPFSLDTLMDYYIA